MKVKQIVTEGKYDAQKFEYEDLPSEEELLLKKVSALANFIYENCQPWLHATQNGRAAVYRGMSARMGEYPPAFIKPVRPKRRPKDSSRSQTALMNKAIATAGLSANRNNSVFVTGNEGKADPYGDVFAVLPVGEFNWTSHPNIEDWWVARERFERGDPDIAKYMVGGNQRYDGLIETIEGSTEIMIQADKIIAINPAVYKSMVLPTLNDQDIPAQVIRNWIGEL